MQGELRNCVTPTKAEKQPQRQRQQQQANAVLKAIFPCPCVPPNYAYKCILDHTCCFELSNRFLERKKIPGFCSNAIFGQRKGKHQTGRLFFYNFKTYWKTTIAKSQKFLSTSSLKVSVKYKKSVISLL